MELTYDDEQGGRAAYAIHGSKTVWIGRAPHCQICVRDESVSRVHAAIEPLAGHHLLSDRESTNGTFLNGNRVPALIGIVLREGDVIEIGTVTLRFGAAKRESSRALFDGSESSHAWKELVDEGHAAARDEDRRAFTLALRALSRPEGVTRALEHIAARLAADVVAVFAPHPSKGVELAVAFPAPDQAEDLAPIARETMASDRGRIVRRHSPDEPPDVVSSVAAVPFCADTTSLGVLAIARRRGARIDRGSLATLAVLGEKLGEALLADTSSEDTPLRLELLPRRVARPTAKLPRR